MMEFKPTTAQLKAMKITDQSILLSAGAGSGKTRVLVQRYLHLIESNLASVEQILAITFTNKAASEMKERVTQEVYKKILNAKFFSTTEKTLESEFWCAVQRDLNFAQITTFHGFCAQILRSNPGFANIDPNFRILDEFEADELLVETIEELFLLELKKKNSSMVRLTHEFSIYTIVDLLKNAYIQGRNNRISFADQFARTQQIMFLSSEMLAKRKIEIINLCKELFKINQAEKLAAGTKKKIDILEAEKSNIFAQIERISNLACEDRSVLVKIKKILQGNLAKNVKTIVARIKDIIDNEFIYYLADQKAMKLMLPLIEVLKMVKTQYILKKKNSNGLDFSDLEEKAIDLLKSQPNFLKALQNKIKFIMVDEFQDTNHAQEELIRLIVSGQQDGIITGNKLLVVGDPKQSIYRFRRADVTVFKKFAAEIDKCGCVIDLNINFRSRKKIVDFVNHLFQQLFYNTDNSYEIKYQNSESTRICAKQDNCIEFTILDKKDCLEMGISAREVEAKVLAARIKKMINNEEKLVYEIDSQGEEISRAANYEDICLLFQALSDVQIYEEALQNLQIPYTIINGKGFYQRQEIIDIINLLQIIENKNRTIEWVGVLRSPFCGLSDEMLFQLLKNSEEVYHELKNIYDNQDFNEEIKQNLQAFLKFYQFARQERDRMEISELIKYLLNKTDFNKIILAHPNSDLVKANLEKLITIAQKYEKKPHSSLSGFIRYINKMSKKDLREGMADIPGKSNTVKLMTIHQSKGLEFPIVIIPDTHRQLFNPNSLPPIFFDPEIGMGMAVYDRLDQKTVKTSILLKISELEKKKEIVERKRLLYVAATRARDYLILSGVSKGFKTGDIDQQNSWLDWLGNIFKLDSLDHLPENISYGENHEHLIKINRNNADYLTVLEEKSLKKDLSLEKLLNNESNVCKELNPKLLNQIKAKANYEKISRNFPSKAKKSNGGKDYYKFDATSLQLYEKSPVLYYQQHILKFPNLIFQSPQNEPFEASAERGILIHLICQYINSISELPEILKVSLARMGLSYVTSKDFEIFLSKLRPYIEKFLHQKHRLELSFDPQNMIDRREYPFSLLLNNKVIKGKIDRLIVDPEQVLIIDYKTNQFFERELEQIAQEYRFQLEIYALAIYQLTQREKITCKIHFLLSDLIWTFNFTLDDLTQIKAKIERLTDEINNRHNWDYSINFFTT